MSKKELKYSKKFLESLVAMRHDLSEGIFGKYQTAGLPGILLADDSGKVKGCIFLSPAHCPPAPFLSKRELSKAIYQAYKMGLSPTGLVLLNPDTGGSAKKKYFIGSGWFNSGRGGDFLGCRGYTLYRFFSLFQELRGLNTMLIVDNAEIPVSISIPIATFKSEDKRIEKINSIFGNIKEIKPTEDTEEFTIKACSSSAARDIIAGGVEVEAYG